MYHNRTGLILKWLLQAYLAGIVVIELDAGAAKWLRQQNWIDLLSAMFNHSLEALLVFSQRVGGSIYNLGMTKEMHLNLLCSNSLCCAVTVCVYILCTSSEMGLLNWLLHINGKRFFSTSWKRAERNLPTFWPGCSSLLYIRTSKKKLSVWL